MMKAEVDSRLADIEEQASVHDDEGAHSTEKKLWHDVLLAIANGASNAQELASAALASRDIAFNRWFA